MTTSTADSAPSFPGTKHTEAEVASQPEMWSRVLDMDDDDLRALPFAGQRVLAVGCGTSYYILESWARLRRQQGLGSTRAVIASEFDGPDGEDVAVLLSRSGTTGDVLRVAAELESESTMAITGTPDSPITSTTGSHLLLDFADEQSVVQTRFATSALTLLRRSVGDQTLPQVVDQARTVLTSDHQIDPTAYDHIVFLGTGWTVGLAHEAALKLRESARMWTEAYPVLEYRHGPIACAGPRTLVWSLCPVPDDVAAAIRRTGATLRETERDPQAELVEVHRTGIAYAKLRGIDCDSPPHLSRSVQT